MKSNQTILNPETNRYINVDGKLFRKLKSSLFDINYEILYENINILFGICNIGRILVFDTSENYIRSKQALTVFLNELKHTHINVETQYMKLVAYSNITLEMIIYSLVYESYNRSLGMDLISIFVRYFTQLERRYDRLQYDIPKTKTFFVQQNKHIVIQDVHIPYEIDEVYKNCEIKLKLKPYLYKYSSSIFDKIRNEENMYTFYTQTSLTEPYMVTLDVKSNWNDIPIWRIVSLNDNYYFDIFFLLKTMFYQLNSSDFNNPRPTFPFNPFTKENINVKKLYSIQYLWRVIHNKSIPKNNVLTFFLNNDFLWIIHEYSIWSEIFFQKISENLRWKRIQNIDSQNNFQGLWIDKHEPLNNIEKLIQKWLDTNNKNIHQKIIKHELFSISNDYIWNPMLS